MDAPSWIAAKREALKKLRVDARNVAPSIRDFTSAVATQKRGLSVVIELARSTFEEGPLVDAFDPAQLAATCDACDVSAVAIATDSIVSGGFPRELAEAARGTSSPILQDDLVLAREQLYEARQLGADASLLRASALLAGELKLLIDLAASTHMGTPVEVQSDVEMARATAAGARILVLPAFDGPRLSLARAEALLPGVPRTSVVLVRGPFAQPEDLRTLRGRADGIWVCGPFMRAPDRHLFLTRLMAAAEAE